MPPTVEDVPRIDGSIMNTTLFWSSWLGTLLIAAVTLAAELPTPLEQAKFGRLSTSAEISEYLHELAEAYPQARVETIGTSVQGRPLEALVLSSAKGRDVSQADRVTIEIVGSQHGMEGAGAESLLFIARELLAGSLQYVLRDVDVVLVPNANPDGLEIGKRVNANGVNLNTDFVALSQPESRALVAALRRFQPEAVLDVHESAVLKKNSLAREGYMTDFTAQFELANNPNIVPSLRAFALSDVLTPWIAGVDAAGLDAHRYFGEIRSSRQAVTNGGLSLQNFRNRTGIEGRLSFLMETRLDPKGGVYPTFRNIGARVALQRISIERFLAVLHERRKEILAAVSVARAELRAANVPLALDVHYIADPQDPPVAIDLQRIADGKRERIEFADSRTVAAAKLLPMPAAYLVRSNQAELAALFDRQGIRYRTIQKPRSIDGVEFVAGPEVAAIDSADTTLVDALPNPTLDKARERRVRVQASPGELWIDLNQQRGRLAALILEPRSDSSLFRTPQYFLLVTAGEPLPIYRVPR
jgi:Zinc carboxypeptidase